MDCNITFQNGKSGTFKCAFSGDIANGAARFVCVRNCGCVFSLSAFENPNVSGDECLICGKELPKNKKDVQNEN